MAEVGTANGGRPRTSDDASEAVVAGGLVRLPRQAADVEVVVDGSKATINGVVEEAETRRSIVESVESLDSISEVEDNLRPPAA